MSKLKSSTRAEIPDWQGGSSSLKPVMPDLSIDHLSLRVENATGHEHRVGPIAERAVAIFADRVSERFAAPAEIPGSSVFDRLCAQTLSLDLSRTSDQQAAEQIAQALLEALALEPRI